MVKTRTKGFSAGNRQGIQDALLGWFSVHQRPLPWREGYDPYHVWIAEMMLQQTQVKTVLTYYARWLRRFPDLEAVARAPEQEVLKAWEGLGYYRRARNVRLAAQQVLERHGGQWPTCPVALAKLPGIGPYTAGAIASIAFNHEAPTVDGNIARVLARLVALPEAVNGSEGQSRLWALASALLPKGRAREFNQGLMELGALICKPRVPACSCCPLRPYCSAGKTGQGAAFPRKLPRAPRREVRGALLLIASGERLLLRRRPSRGLWGGLWELPWVECALEQNSAEAGWEALRQAVGGVAPTASAVSDTGRELGAVSHGLTHLQLHLRCFAFSLSPTVSQPADPPPATAQCWAGPTRRKSLAITRLGHKALALWEAAR